MQAIVRMFTPYIFNDNIILDGTVNSSHLIGERHANDYDGHLASIDPIQDDPTMHTFGTIEKWFNDDIKPFSSYDSYMAMIKDIHELDVTNSDLGFTDSDFAKAAVLNKVKNYNYYKYSDIYGYGTNEIVTDAFKDTVGSLNVDVDRESEGLHLIEGRIHKLNNSNANIDFPASNVYGFPTGVGRSQWAYFEPSAFTYNEESEFFKGLEISNQTFKTETGTHNDGIVPKDTKKIIIDDLKENVYIDLIYKCEPVHLKINFKKKGNVAFTSDDLGVGFVGISSSQLEGLSVTYAKSLYIDSLSGVQFWLSSIWNDALSLTLAKKGLDLLDPRPDSLKLLKDEEIDLDVDDVDKTIIDVSNNPKPDPKDDILYQLYAHALDLAMQADVDKFNEEAEKESPDADKLKGYYLDYKSKFRRKLIYNVTVKNDFSTPDLKPTEDMLKGLHKAGVDIFTLITVEFVEDTVTVVGVLTAEALKGLNDLIKSIGDALKEAADEIVKEDEKEKSDNA